MHEESPTTCVRPILVTYPPWTYQTQGPDCAAMDFTQGIRSYLTRQIQESLDHLIEGGIVSGITGDVVLDNLSLRKNLLRNLLNLPLEYDIARGTAKELRLSIPWARIIAQSQPVVQVTLKTVEIVVKRAGTGSEDADSPASPDVPPDSSDLELHPPTRASRRQRGSIVTPEEQESMKVVGSEKPTGWLHALGKKMLMNVALRVENLAVRYEEHDGSIAAAAYICNVTMHSADPGREWEPAFNDCDPPSSPWLFKMLQIQDLTICLDGHSPEDISMSGSSRGRRRHEAPLVDRTTLRFRLAFDVRDAFNFWGWEAPPSQVSSLSPPSPPHEPASSKPPFFQEDHFSPMSMDGLFLDSPYVVSSPPTGTAANRQMELVAADFYEGHLPATFGALCPVLARVERGEEDCRKAELPRPTATPWQAKLSRLFVEKKETEREARSAKGGRERGVKEGGQAGGRWDSRVHAALVVDAECDRLRVSFSENQASLLCELWARANARTGQVGRTQSDRQKTKGRARECTDDLGAVRHQDGQEFAATSESCQKEGQPAVSWYSRMYITSFRLHAFYLALLRSSGKSSCSRKAPSVGGSGQHDSLLVPLQAQTSWVFLRLRALGLSVDSQELRGIGATKTCSRTRDVRGAMRALEVACAGEDTPEAAEAGWGEQGGGFSSTMPVLLQWGETRESEKEEGPTASAPILLEALFKRTLLVKASNRSDDYVEKVLQGAEGGLRPLRSTVLVVRYFQERHSELRGRDMGDRPWGGGDRETGEADSQRIVVDVLFSEALRCRLTPAVVLGLACFVSPPLRASSVSPAPNAYRPWQTTCNIRIGSLQVAFACNGPGGNQRPECLLQLEDLDLKHCQQGPTSHHRSCRMARLAIGMKNVTMDSTSASRLGTEDVLTLFEAKNMSFSLESSIKQIHQRGIWNGRKSSLDEEMHQCGKISMPLGVSLSVIPAYWRFGLAISTFLCRNDGNALDATIAGLPLVHPPNSFVCMTCECLEVAMKKTAIAPISGSVEDDTPTRDSRDMLEMVMKEFSVSQKNSHACRAVIDKEKTSGPCIKTFPETTKGSFLILQTPVVWVKTITSVQEGRDTEMSVPQQFTFYVSPLNIWALRTAALEITRLMAALPSSPRIVGASTREKMRLCVDTFTIMIDMPWLAGELPRAVFACRGGEWVVSNEGRAEALIHNHLGIAHVRVEGHVPPHNAARGSESSFSNRHLEFISNKLLPFLLPVEEESLKAALQQARHQGSKFEGEEMVVVPLLVPDEDCMVRVAKKAFVEISWQSERKTRAMVHMEVAFEPCQCILYCPFLYALLRLGTLASKPMTKSSSLHAGKIEDREERMAKADDEEDVAPPCPTLLLTAQTSRVLLLGGTLQDARFGVSIDLDNLVLWRRGESGNGRPGEETEVTAPAMPMEIRRLGFGAQMGQWRVDANQGLELVHAWNLIERVDFEVEGGKGAFIKEDVSRETARTVLVSPLALTLGTLEMAVLWRVVGVFGRNVTRAPLVQCSGNHAIACREYGNDGHASTSARLRNADKDVGKELPNLRLACPYLYVSFKSPRHSSRDFCAEMPPTRTISQAVDMEKVAFHLKLEDCTLSLGTHGGHFDVARLVIENRRATHTGDSLTHHRGLALLPRPDFLSLFSGTSALTFAWHKPANGNASEMIIQLQPSILYLDPHSCSTLRSLGGFMNLDLEMLAAKDATEARAVAVAAARRSRGTRLSSFLLGRTETTKLVTDHLKVVLSSDSRHAGLLPTLEIEADQVLASLRTAGYNVDHYLNMVQTRISILMTEERKMTNHERCKQATEFQWPLLIGANIFVTQEDMRRCLRQPLSHLNSLFAAATPLPPSVSIQLEPLQFHFCVPVIDHLQTLVQAFSSCLVSTTPSYSSTRTVGAVSPGASLPHGATTREQSPFTPGSCCHPLTTWVALSALEMTAFEGPLPEPEPGALLMRCHPALAPSSSSAPAVDKTHSTYRPAQHGDTRTLACLTALKWQFPLPVRARSVRCPDHIILQSVKYTPPADFPTILELAVVPEGEISESGEMNRCETGNGRESNVVVRWKVRFQAGGDEDGLVATAEARSEREVGAKEKHKELHLIECDQGIGGRRWQLNLYWDRTHEHHHQQQHEHVLQHLWPPNMLSLECVWRPMVLSLANLISLELFLSPMDQIQSILHVTIPHAFLQLYPKETRGAEGITVAPGRGEIEDRGELAVVSMRDLDVRYNMKEQGVKSGLLTVRDLEMDVVDVSRWTLLPALRGNFLTARYSAGNEGSEPTSRDHTCSSPGLSHDSSPPRYTSTPGLREEDKTGHPVRQSLGISVDWCRINVSRRIMQSIDVLRQDFKARNASITDTTPPSSAARCYRYKIVNHTQHSLWLGQHLTNEIIRAAPCSSQEYTARAWAKVAGRQPSSLLLRFALNMTATSEKEHSATTVASTMTTRNEMIAGVDGPSVWSEPVDIDLLGARCLPLRTSGQGHHDVFLLLDKVLSGTDTRDKPKISRQLQTSPGNREVLMWVVVEKKGLETRVSLHGGCEIRNYLPVGLDIRICSQNSEGAISPSFFASSGPSASKKRSEAVVNVKAGPGGLPLAMPPSQEALSLLLDEGFMAPRSRIRGGNNRTSGTRKEPSHNRTTTDSNTFSTTILGSDGDNIAGGLSGDAMTAPPVDSTYMLQKLMMVQARVSSRQISTCGSSSSDPCPKSETAFGQTMILTLPEIVQPDQACKVNLTSPHRHPMTSCTVLGQAPPASPGEPTVWFLCHLRRVILHSQKSISSACPTHSDGRYIWGWLSLELWPLAYLMNSGLPLDHRVLPGKHPQPVAASPLTPVSRNRAPIPLHPTPPCESMSSMPAPTPNLEQDMVARDIDDRRRNSNLSMSANDSESGKVRPSARDVDAAKRAIHDKIQLLSQKRLQKKMGMTREVSAPSSTDGRGDHQNEDLSIKKEGGLKPSANSAAFSLYEPQNDRVWSPLSPGAPAAIAVCRTDPRYGLAFSVRPSTSTHGTNGTHKTTDGDDCWIGATCIGAPLISKSQRDFSMSSSDLLAWVRSGNMGHVDGNAALDECPQPLLNLGLLGPAGEHGSIWNDRPGCFSGQRLIPYAVRRPAYLGPSLLVDVTPLWTVANHCPFPLSLLALVSRRPMNTTGASNNVASMTAGFGDFNDAGFQVLPPDGKVVPLNNSAWPFTDWNKSERSVGPNGSTGMPAFAVGVKIMEDSVTGELKLQDAQLTTAPAQQCWCKPVGLDALVASMLPVTGKSDEERTGITHGIADISLFVPVQGDKWLPLTLRLISRSVRAGGRRESVGIGECHDIKSTGRKEAFSNAHGLGMHRLEIRPRLVLQNSMRLPARDCVAVYYPDGKFHTAFNNDHGQERSHPKISKADWQIILLRRSKDAFSPKHDEKSMVQQKGSSLTTMKGGMPDLPLPSSDILDNSTGGIDLLSSPLSSSTVPYSSLPPRSRMSSTSSPTMLRRVWCRASRRPSGSNEENDSDDEAGRTEHQVRANKVTDTKHVKNVTYRQTFGLCIVAPGRPLSTAAVLSNFRPTTFTTPSHPVPGAGTGILDSSDYHYRMLEIEALGEDAREIHLRCPRPGAGLMGPNGKDIMAIRAHLKYHEGTFYVQISAEPSIPLVVLNRSSLYDIHVGVERWSIERQKEMRKRRSNVRDSKKEEYGSESGSLLPMQHTLCVPPGARVEWNPSRPDLYLSAIATPILDGSNPLSDTDVDRQDLDGCTPGITEGAAMKNDEGASGAAFRRSTFSTKKTPTFDCRLRCALAAGKAGIRTVEREGGEKGEWEDNITSKVLVSTWSSLLHTGKSCGDGCHRLNMSFWKASGSITGEKSTIQSNIPKSSAEEEIEGDGEELLRAFWRTSLAAVTATLSTAAGISCLVIDDCLEHPHKTATDVGNIPGFSSAPRLKVESQRDRLTTLTVGARVLDLQLLEDDVAIQKLGGYAGTSTRSNGARENVDEAVPPGALHLPALLFIRFSGVETRYDCSVASGDAFLKGSRTLNVSLDGLQVDHLANGAEFPVVLYFFDKQRQRRDYDEYAVLDFTFKEVFLNPIVMGEGRPLSYVEMLKISSSRVRVGVDGALLHTIRFFQENLTATEKGEDSDASAGWDDRLGVPRILSNKVGPAVLTENDQTPCTFFQSVTFSPLSVLLDARVFVPGSRVFLGLDGSPLFFEGVRLTDVFSTPQAFLKGILSNYVADAIFRSPALLGSLEIIGSPAILVSRVVSGLKDLVMLSASGSLTGAGRGLLSLTRHVVGGTLASLAGFSSSVRRNLEPGERVRGGQPHGIHDAHFHRRSGSVEFSGNGGTRAGKGEEGRRLSLPAGLDVGGSAEGSSKDGGTSGGSGNLLAGVGRGLYKAVTFPISGAMGVIWWTSDRLITSTGVNRGLEEGRERLDYGPAGAGASCSVHWDAYYRHSCGLRFRKGTLKAVIHAYMEQKREKLYVEITGESEQGGTRGWFGRFIGGGDSARDSSNSGPSSSDNFESGQTTILPVRVVLAEEDAIYIIAHSHGAETSVFNLRLSNAGALKWRHVQVEASPSSLGSIDGITIHRGLAKYEASIIDGKEHGEAWWWHLIEMHVDGGERGVIDHFSPLKLWLVNEEQVRLLKGFLSRWANGTG